jgi:hypothetical protein
MHLFACPAGREQAEKILTILQGAAKPLAKMD